MPEQTPKKGQPRTILRKRLLLAVLSMTKGNIRQACERARVSRDTYYDWRGKDHEFAEGLKAIEMENIAYALDEIKKEFPDF